MKRLSFRARVILLLFVVAAASAGATAALTVRQTAQQVTQSAVLDQQDITEAADAITRYGLLNKTWQGVDTEVAVQAERINQRVRLQTTDDQLVADSDPAAGPAPPRETFSVQTRVPLPPVRQGSSSPQQTYGPLEPGEYDPAVLHRLLSTELVPYFLSRAAARCANRGYPVSLFTDIAGLRRLTQQQRCDGGSEPDTEKIVSMIEQECRSDQTCILREYDAQVAALTPPPAQLLVGSVDQPPPPARISIVPALVVAGLVALVALAAGLLISRRVLRPIGALAGASQRIGDGNLDERVPVRGGDELARLGQSFNRMAASLQRSKEQQHTMIADIAHELRTPIANIRGYLEALQDGVFSPDQELFHSLYEEALLQQRLIDDLQELALAEAGSLEYHPVRLDLAELLRASGIAHSGSTTVRIEVDAPEPVVVLADPDRFRQVTANLLTNAVRATSPNGVVRLRAGIEDGSALVQVADTGHGIAPADLPHVFDRFWRADAARGRHSGGRGLGLAITREIVTAHDGTITVASALGVGTVFTVRLPLAEENPEPPAIA
ncbi:ATP-binding protein [Amycolatopsis sp. PS_44_ISF1]|uniref:sensor histidine kinase n=1 Tax=Amycolatopsis sp. PS_44_ISF1 TaxID=2974917 RepID=UPI0028DDFEEA|nr:ATP-binding protein [Amycolatopsis sp. PS_44_ISF1]MDT8914993.1 ATP-binding protein [Amycolatopsis sp. PS_44_ISF1]